MISERKHCCGCRFEQLALDYDSDELGDLDELDGGGASLDDFDTLLTECLAEQQSSQYVNAGPGQDHGSSSASRPALSSRLQDEVPDIAVAKVLSYFAPDQSFHKIRQPGHRGF